PPQPSGMGMGGNGPGGGGGGPGMQARRQAPPTPGYSRGAPGQSGGVMPQPPAPAPAPDMGGRGGPPGGAPGMGPTLFLVYNGQRYPVTKDQFIIGRGSKTSDLPIKDGNISRKHAAVIRRNGTFYIKDLGSTNGIDYKGMRIDNKRIDEGDVFHLCDYELRFTYRAD
ncbi:MAG TPA: FHA domain-containing protein, partial [Kofleriaceae bacterium]